MAEGGKIGFRGSFSMGARARALPPSTRCVRSGSGAARPTAREEPQGADDGSEDCCFCAQAGAWKLLSIQDLGPSGNEGQEERRIPLLGIENEVIPVAQLQGWDVCVIDAYKNTLRGELDQGPSRVSLPLSVPDGADAWQPDLQGVRAFLRRPGALSPWIIGQLDGSRLTAPSSQCPLLLESAQVSERRDHGD